MFPIPLTFAWVITKRYEDKADPTYCGIGYSLLPSYWILEGPRIAAIMVNTDRGSSINHVVKFLGTFDTPPHPFVVTFTY